MELLKRKIKFPLMESKEDDLGDAQAGAEREDGTADESEEQKAEGEDAEMAEKDAARTEQWAGQEGKEVSLSHVLTNVVILQGFVLELVALLQVRATLFGEVRYV